MAIEIIRTVPPIINPVLMLGSQAVKDRLVLDDESNARYEKQGVDRKPDFNLKRYRDNYRTGRDHRG